MVKQTIEFSDGSETVMHFTQNEHGEAIETQVAEAVAENQPEETIPESETPTEEVSETSEEIDLGE